MDTEELGRLLDRVQETLGDNVAGRNCLWTLRFRHGSVTRVTLTELGGCLRRHGSFQRVRRLR